MGQKFAAGKNHSFVTKAWDDGKYLTYADHKISKIKLIYDHVIFGIQVFYRVAPHNLTEMCPLHLGHLVGNYKVKEKEVLFEDDEYLIEVYGRYGEAIDQIGFKSNKGDLGRTGGDGGSTTFSLKADPDYYFSTFSGGTGGLLDYIQMTQTPFPKDLNKFVGVTKPSADYFQECLKRVSPRLLTKPSKQDILEEVNNKRFL